MIAYITVWIKNIIFVVLFASFLELLLPNNSMQRFVRVIMGLFILLAILNPIVSVMESKMTTAPLPALAIRTDNNLINADIVNATTSVAEKRDLLARELYIRDLSKQIRATVMAIDGVADAKVTVNLENDSSPISKGVGKIKNIVIHIEPGMVADGRKITKVTVGATTQETEPSKLPVEVVDKTKKAVAELYQLKSSQIEVK